MQRANVGVLLVVKEVFRSIVTFPFALITFFLFIYKRRIDFSSSINTNIFAHYGTVVGSLVSAVLSIVSIFLIIQSINDVRSNSTRQQIES